MNSITMQELDISYDRTNSHTTLPKASKKMRLGTIMLTHTLTNKMLSASKREAGCNSFIYIPCSMATTNCRTAEPYKHRTPGWGPPEQRVSPLPIVRKK
jgi:hypothetical protein